MDGMETHWRQEMELSREYKVAAVLAWIGICIVLPIVLFVLSN